MKSTFVQVLWIFFVSLQLWPTITGAQPWEWTRRFGLDDAESGRKITVRSDGDIFWAGTFEETTQIGSTSLTGNGENDLFLVRATPAGDPQWVRQIGSLFDDEINGLGADSSGNLYAGGTYWLEVQIGSAVLTTERNPKSIFLAKYDGDGGVLWARSIDGSDSKDLGDLAVTDDGTIFITGYFSDSLFLADTVLTAAGQTDSFAARYSPDGALQWAANWGYSGDARATCLATDNEGGLVLGGFYNDTLIVDGMLIRSISLDLDVFLLRITYEGQPLWLRKAGGVQDQELTDLLITSNGQLYGTGFLVGVMTLGDGVVIQSQTGNPDGYLFHYTLDGDPVGARAFGNNLVQQSLNIASNGTNVLIAGLYQGTLEIDGQTAPAGSGFSGFVAGFESDLSLRWLVSVTGDAPVINYSVAAGSDGAVYTTGSFSGSADFDDQTLTAVGPSDAFLARLSSQLTPVREPAVEGDGKIRIYPNPAKTWLSIESGWPAYEVRLIHPSGKLLRRVANGRRIDLSTLPGGWYFLLVLTEQGIVYRERLLVVSP